MKQKKILPKFYINATEGDHLATLVDNRDKYIIYRLTELSRDDLKYIHKMIGMYLKNPNKMIKIEK